MFVMEIKMRRIFWIFLISFFSFYIIADDLLDSVLLKKPQEVVNESSNTPSSEQSIQQSSTDVSNQKFQDFSLNTGASFESKEKKEAIEICAIYRLGDVDSGYDIEFSVPISSTFSLSVRGAYFTRKVEGYYSTWYSTYSWNGIYYYRDRYLKTYKYSYTETFWDCSPLIIWEPLKENLFSPYIAAGGRYSHFDSDYDDIEEFGYVALAGLRLNLGFLTLRGEYSFGSYGESEATEILGDVGISVTDSMQLHVNYKIFDSDDADDSISMYGGGISFGF